MQAEDWRSISKIRLERAVEFYDDATALYKEGRYRSTASRLYFSVFHAMRAELALDGIDRKHHSGIISEFRRLYVKTGIFDREVSSIIATMSLMRHDSDYDDYIPIEKEDLDDMIPKVERLLDSVQDYLQPLLYENSDSEQDNGMNMGM